MPVNRGRRTDRGLRRAGEATSRRSSGCPTGKPARDAYQIVHDEAMSTATRANLATFVGTWRRSGQRLYLETADKNIIEKDEYPQTAAIGTRCWTKLAPSVASADPDTPSSHLDHRLLGGLHLLRAGA
jgi:glutamate decarboxylase